METQENKLEDDEIEIPEEDRVETHVGRIHLHSLIHMHFPHTFINLF